MGFDAYISTSFWEDWGATWVLQGPRSEKQCIASSLWDHNRAASGILLPINFNTHTPLHWFRESFVQGYLLNFLSRPLGLSITPVKRHLWEINYLNFLGVSFFLICSLRFEGIFLSISCETLWGECFANHQSSFRCYVFQYMGLFSCFMMSP